MSIGLATLRVDGFASIDAGYDGGWVSTRPLTLGGDTLSMNVVSDYGEARVEVLDEAGKPVAGFTEADCIPVSADSLDARIEWAGGRSVSELGDTTVKLKFRLKNARLYSYRCV